MSGFQTGGFNTLPPVVKNLLIINILLFLSTELLTRTAGIDLRDLLGLHWIGSSKFEFYQPITYMFMHGDFRHILFNMFAVWMFGNAIENMWGSKRFLIYYVITGLGAAVLHYGIVYYESIQGFNHLMDLFLQHPSTETLETFFNSYKLEIQPGTAIQIAFDENQAHLQNILSGSNAISDLEPAYAFMETYKQYFLNMPNVIGASGSLFGILLAFGMMFPNAELYMMFIPIPIKAKYFVAGYGFFELYAGFSGSSDGIAHFAHLGGLITGFILIKIWQRFDPSFRLL